MHFMIAVLMKIQTKLHILNRNWIYCYPGSGHFLQAHWKSYKFHSRNIYMFWCRCKKIYHLHEQIP